VSAVSAPRRRRGAGAASDDRWTPRHAPGRRPDGARLALVVTACAVAALPMLKPGGPGNIAPVDLLLGAALAACVWWARTGARAWRFPFAASMGLFIAGGAIGAAAGPVPGNGVIALVQDVVLLLWCWAVVNVATTPERLRVLLATWAYSAIAWATVLFLGLAAHVSALSGQVEREGSRTSLRFGDPNYAASYFVISIMVLWASGRPRNRVGRALAYLLLVAALASTGSNSGLIGLVVATSVAAVIGVHARGGTMAALAAAAFLAVGGVALTSQIRLHDVQRAARGTGIAFLRDGIGRSEQSVTQRGEVLRASALLFRTGGPLGSGPASTKQRLSSELAPFVKEAHDDYMAALVERGIVGSLGLLLLLAAIGRRLPFLARSRLPDGYAAVVVRPNALVGAVAGVFVAMAFNELLHVRHVWTLFALVAALQLAASDGARGRPRRRGAGAR
jgi:hypothetical protein